LRACLGVFNQSVRGKRISESALEAVFFLIDLLLYYVAVLNSDFPLRALNVHSVLDLIGILSLKLVVFIFFIFAFFKDIVC